MGKDKKKIVSIKLSATMEDGTKQDILLRPDQADIILRVCSLGQPGPIPLIPAKNDKIQIVPPTPGLKKVLN